MGTEAWLSLVLKRWMLLEISRVSDSVKLHCLVGGDWNALIATVKGEEEAGCAQ